MSYLASLAVSGVYSIENGGYVYVSYSKNVLKAFAEHMELIKKGRHEYIKAPDLERLEYKLLEEVQIGKLLKLRYGAWCESYRNSGHKLYRNYVAIKYKVKTRVSNEVLLTSGVDSGYVVVVELVNSRNESFIVGIFNKNEYAEEFIKKYYGQNDIFQIVYSQNELTQKFCSERKL